MTLDLTPTPVLNEQREKPPRGFTCRWRRGNVQCNFCDRKYRLP